ncbi:MAG TPA: epoxyqueuosine reductase QueH, partial [Desulfurivibrionaceae bacterium]|nr:epoxyqueuosine reductase QueH [Desulfurivibrionaceae bacterium]
KPTGFFYNPNIHPFQEFQRRLEALDSLSAAMDFQVAAVREYGLTEYLRQVVFHEEERCLRCYEMRLVATASHAKETGADAFTTTLLYSRYQKHEAIRAIGERIGAASGVPFYYRDFREGWQQGIDASKAMGLYRQPYCGCIYSEQERYDKKNRRQK